MTLNSNEKRINRVISLYVVIYPIIFRYNSIIPFVTLGELIGLILLIFYFASSAGKINMYLPVLLFSFCFLGRAMLSILSNEENAFNSAGSGFRIALLYFFILCFTRCFDYYYGKKCLYYISIIIVVYELLQLLFSIRGIYLSTSLPFLTPMRDTDREVLEKALYGIRFRPCAVFGEPGELGAYLTLPLALCLFDDSEKLGDKRWIVRSIIFSIGLVATLSSTGTVMAIILWGVFFLKARSSSYFKITLIIIAVIGLIVGEKLGVWEYFLSRLFNDSGIAGITSSTHFRDIPHIFSNFSGLKNILIGVGIVDPDGFLSGLPRLFYWLGLVGTFVFMALMYRISRQGTKTQRRLVFVWIVINVAGSYLLGAFAMPFMMFMLIKRQNVIE